MMKVRLAILWLVAVVGLLFVNYSIYGKEQLIRNGQPILLELAPVDPRSLIQGDYMALRYKIADDVFTASELAPRGKLVIRVADNGVTSFVRVDDGTPLGPNERLLNYYKHEWQIDLGAPSFFFQEGTSEAYATAKYGEMRVEADGTSVLIGLRDEKLQPLGSVQQP